MIDHIFNRSYLCEPPFYDNCYNVIGKPLPLHIHVSCVSCRNCDAPQVEMESVGLTTEFAEIDIDVTAAKHWEGVRTRYYWDKKYHLPTARKALTDDAGPGGVDTDGQQLD